MHMATNFLPWKFMEKSNHVFRFSMEYYCMEMLLQLIVKGMSSYGGCSFDQRKNVGILMLHYPAFVRDILHAVAPSKALRGLICKIRWIAILLPQVFYKIDESAFGRGHKRVWEKD